MAIINQDGKQYKLRGPNPMMKTQELWDTSKIILHNMQFEPLIVEETKKDQTIIDSSIGKEIIVPDTKSSPIEEPKPTVVKIEEPTQQVVPEIKQPIEERYVKILEERKIIFHCLPVEIHHFEDAFYGEATQRISFGGKFDFPGIIVSIDDLEITFWSDRPIKEKSIIFPTKLEMKRWWRVDKNEEKSGGYMHYAVPSDISPDFS